MGKKANKTGFDFMKTKATFFDDKASLI